MNSNTPNVGLRKSLLRSTQHPASTSRLHRITSRHSLHPTYDSFEQTGDTEFLDWYDRIHEYSFAHFPVKEHGEWTQKLNRDGTPLDAVVAFPVKDPHFTCPAH